MDVMICNFHNCNCTGIFNFGAGRNSPPLSMLLIFEAFPLGCSHCYHGVFLWFLTHAYERHGENMDKVKIVETNNHNHTNQDIEDREKEWYIYSTIKSWKIL